METTIQITNQLHNLYVILNSSVFIQVLAMYLYKHIKIYSHPCSLYSIYSVPVHTSFKKQTQTGSDHIREKSSVNQTSVTY